MHGRFALLPLLAIAALGALWLWLQRDSEDRKPAVVGPDRAERADETPLESRAREGARSELLLPEQVPATTPGSGAEESAGEFAPTGVLTIVGRVLDEEDLPIEGARISVFREVEYTPGQLHLGTTVSRANGSFVFSLGALETLPGPVLENASIVLRALASGYGPSEEYVYPNEREGSLLRCSLVLEDRSRSVTGRVVAQDGSPVVEARIAGVAWGRIGTEMEELEALSDASGEFVVSFYKFGRVDLMLSHAAHGSAHVETEVTHEQQLVDVGRVILQSGHVLGGSVVSAGGQPLAHIEVSAWPTDEELESDGFDSRTDARGRFRFAALQNCEYRLETGYGGEALRVQPDRADLRLRMPVHSLRVRIRDSLGRVVPTGDVSILRLKRSGEGDWVRAGSDPDGWTIGEGLLQFLVGQPGVYAAHVRTRIEDGWWSASKRFVVDSGEDKELELTLRREDFAPVRIVVFDPEGIPMPRWKVVPRSLSTGGTYNATKSDRATLTCPPGRYLLRVSDLGSSLVASFQEQVEITDSTEAIELRAEAWLGELELTVDTTTRMGKKKLIAFASLRRLDDDSAGQNNFRPAVGGGASRHRNVPGRFEVKVSATGYVTILREVELRPRQTTRLQVTLQPTE